MQVKSLSMFDSLLSSVVFIDTDNDCIRLFRKDKKSKKFICSVETFKSVPYTESFYEMLKNVLSIHSADLDGRISLILSDSLFVSDTIKIPLIQKSAMQNSLNLAIHAIYKNAKDIKFKSFPLSQNKQNVTYNIFGIRKEILDNIVKCIESTGVNVANVTLRSNALVNGAFAINSKIKNSNFILLDVKESFAKFSFVINGKTVGFYSLPFGYNVLDKFSIKDEINLFDHTAGDLLVLNAKELAKKKRLTELGDYAPIEDLAEADELSDIDSDLESEVDPVVQEPKVGALYKRTNRKLPKFMLRTMPESEEGFVYENFRIFVKWTLELIRNNNEIFRHGMPNNVFVNIPSEYNFVFEMVNQNLSNKSLCFQPLSIDENPILCNNLELYGGFFVKKYNKFNNF